MATKFMKGARIEWNGQKYLKGGRKAVDKVLKRGAWSVLRDAIALAPKATGRLAREIDLRKSIFENGGYIVYAQGPGNYTRYYAAFVELGLKGKKDRGFIKGHPGYPGQEFLQKAIDKNWRHIGDMVQRAIANDYQQRNRL